jgi:dolichol-phosphate mannosyltransferase
MPARFLTALPVYNEASHVMPVLDEVLRYSPSVLVVDDGSTDGTSALLESRRDVTVVRHPRNLGYGAALQTAFQFARDEEYDVLVTIDCDGQHQPCRISQFVTACTDVDIDVDIVSGSRYLQRFPGDSQPPPERQRINRQITAELNQLLGLRLTDAFCGFKAYRVAALARMEITEQGYGMPLELWVQAAALGLSIKELPVPLIYLEEKRSFGGSLDDAARRYQYYQDVLRRSREAVKKWPRAAAAKTASIKPSLCGKAAE